MKKGPRYSIPSLPEIGNALNQIVEWVESIPINKQIRSGPHIKISEDDSSIVISGTPGGEGTGDGLSCLFKFGTEEVRKESFQTNTITVAKLYSLGGTLNGILPANYEDIGEIQDDTDYYLYLVGQVGTEGIAGVRYEIETDVEIKPQYTAWRPPPEFKFVLGQIQNNIVYPNFCENINAKPDIAYIDEEAVPATPYYFWNIS